jgi:hypothetical protein
MAKSELIQLRNKNLVYRFHELYNIKRMRMDDVLRELSGKQFYLKEETIYSLIFYNKENNSYYQRLVEELQRD